MKSRFSFVQNDVINRPHFQKDEPAGFLLAEKYGHMYLLAKQGKWVKLLALDPDIVYHPFAGNDAKLIVEANLSRQVCFHLRDKKSDWGLFDFSRQQNLLLRFDRRVFRLSGTVVGSFIGVEQQRLRLIFKAKDAAVAEKHRFELIRNQWRSRE